MSCQRLNAATRLFLLSLLLFHAGCRPTASSLPGANSRDSASDISADEATLGIEKQKYIWDIEHAAFELEKKFGKSLLAALRSRDVNALSAFCRPGATANVPDSNREKRADKGYLRQFATGGDLHAVEAAELAEHLCEYVADFESIEKMTCRVLDLHADERRPESGLWSVSLYLAGAGKDGAGEFVEFVTHHHLRCAFADDAAIEAGTIVDHWAVDSEEFRYCDGPLFEEVTTQAGLDDVDIQDNWNVEPDRVRQYNSQMAVEDFDRDGFLDLAVASANGRWRLLRSNQGRSWTDVTDAVRLPLWSSEEPRSRSLEDQAFLATWIDFDNDHYPDLILGDRLYRNLEGKRFKDVTDSSGLIFAYNPKGCVVADFDCDGRLDLYVLYQNPRHIERQRAAGWVGDDESGETNDLWRNEGGGRFVNVTERSQAGGGRRQSFAAVWFHANDDHYPDLYVANDFGPNSLLLNRGNGSFEDIAESTKVSDYSTSMGVAAGDVTGDGLADIYVANMFSKMGRRIIAHVDETDYPPGIYPQIKGSCAGNRLYAMNTAHDQYNEFSELAGVNQVGWAYAPALADFDADGRLDIYSTTGFLSYRRDKPDG